MSWLRTDDDMLDHEKWRRAIRMGGDGVLLMWWRFSAWCSRRLTDGRVPADMVEELAEIGGSKTRAKQLRALIEAQLLAWCDPAEDSTEVRRGVAEPSPRERRANDELVVVGYLKRNASRSKIEHDLERKAQSQRDYELRRRTDASVTNQGPIRVRSPDDVPIPSHPIPSHPIESAARSARASPGPTPFHREQNPPLTSRVVSLPSEEPTQEYLDAAAMAGIAPAQARSTWEHYWGDGLPARGVERLVPWLVKRAKERSNQLARTPQRSSHHDHRASAKADAMSFLLELSQPEATHEA